MGGRIKERGKDRKEKDKKKNGDEVALCLVNRGLIVLPWTQLQRGKKSIFSYYSTVRRENPFVNGIKSNDSMSVYLLRARKISQRYNYIIQQCNKKSTLSHFKAYLRHFSSFLKKHPWLNVSKTLQRANTSTPQ